MEINGLPLHPLVVHAAVVLVPLAALAGLLHVARPGWRWLSRWPLVALAAVAALAVTAAYLSGEDLLETRFGGQPQLPPALATHQERAELLLWAVWAFAAVAVLAAWALGGTSPLVSGRGARQDRRPWHLPAAVLLVAAGLLVLVLAVLTGDAGSRAVWG